MEGTVWMGQAVFIKKLLYMTSDVEEQLLTPEVKKYLSLKKHETSILYSELHK